MLIILILTIGLALGYTIAIISRRKAQPPAREFPQQAASPQNPASQNPSYLEDKIWYEGEINFLFRFNEKLVSALDLQAVVSCITEAAHNFLPVERSVFLRWDKDSEKFTLACAAGLEQGSNREFPAIGKDSISGFVMGNRDMLVVPDLAQDPYLSNLNKEEYLQRTFISAPLLYKDEVLGVLHVCGKKTPGPFAQREVSVVKYIVRMGAVTLQNALLYEQVSKRAVELKIAYDELKEMQGKLIQSEKLKAIGQLASSVAHEIRNPIAIITQGVAYLEQVTPPDAKERREALSMVRESVQRADGIINSLLDFSRARKLELQPEDVGPILENSLSLVKAELKNIKVAKEIREGLPKVMADKNKLMQVFINLFMNAVHAMSGTGQLTIRSFVKQAREAGREAVVIEIEDTGAGISEENLKKIFEPFFTTKDPGKGTGLGLSVCQNIIMMHKGAIEVKSRVGKGTTIIITLEAVTTD